MMLRFTPATRRNIRCSKSKLDFSIIMSLYHILTITSTLLTSINMFGAIPVFLKFYGDVRSQVIQCTRICAHCVLQPCKTHTALLNVNIKSKNSYTEQWKIDLQIYTFVNSIDYDRFSKGLAQEEQKQIVPKVDNVAKK